jgi:hypothetical protein
MRNASIVALLVSTNKITALQTGRHSRENQKPQIYENVTEGVTKATYVRI